MIDEFSKNESYKKMIDIHERYMAELQELIGDVDMVDKSEPFDEYTFLEWQNIVREFDQINKRIGEIMQVWISNQYCEYARFKREQGL